MLRKIRFSIAGLMVVVVVAGLGSAALRHASEAWAGSLLLVTCGILLLAVVGAVCRGPDERAWWLGMSLFGWGYLALAYAFSFSKDGPLPTITLAEVIGSRLGVVLDSSSRDSGEGWNSLSPSDRILHCLWALSIAVPGGLLAVALVAFPGVRASEFADRSSGDRERSPDWWRRPVTLGLMGFALVALAALLLRSAAPGIRAGITFLLTCGLLGLAMLGAVFSRGLDREIWLGASLFGFGYLLLTFGWSPERSPWARRPAEPLLIAILRHGDPSEVSEFPDAESRIRAANRRILRELERPIPMHFPDETPLDHVLRYIKQSTQDSGYPGIPIYIDPMGLKEAGKTLSSTVSIDFESIPVKDALRLCLKQLGMAFGVRSGYLTISSEGEPMVPVHDDPVMIIGHCALALIAAGLGGVAAPLVSDLRWRPTAA